MDPVKAFVKHAFDEGMGKEAVPAWMTSPAAKTIGTAAGIALAAPIAGAAIGGIGEAAQGIYNAVTKKRDFNSMLEFNQDLRHMHRADPKMINASFSTLRRINPSYSRDPLVAGAFVRNLAAAPEGAFNAANTAASARIMPGLAEQGFAGNIGAGVQAGTRHMTDESPDQQQARAIDLARKKQLMSTVGAKGNVATPEFTYSLNTPRGQLKGKAQGPTGLTPEAQHQIELIRRMA